MATPIIQIRGLGKKYRIADIQKAQQQSIVVGMKNTAKSVWNSALKLAGLRARKEPNTIWALRDINLEIAKGEVVGLIGHNGAGKSTLLKILTRITSPTEGEAYLRGRVGSLLEVGTGFQGMLSGRENVYLNGAIIGMTRAEIDRKFDDIVEFSGVGEFIDTPVRHYSSGMYLRLAFAVASYLEPEILLVDEVLAVGDAEFQKRCLGRMNDVADEGRTVMFVSHNMAAIESLCTRVIWLDKGTVRADGPTHQIIKEYLQTTVSHLTYKIWEDKSTAPSTNQITMHRAMVYPQGGSPNDVITVADSFVLAFEYWNDLPGRELTLTLTVTNEENVVVFSSGTMNEPNWEGKPFEQGLYRSECVVPGFLLNKGSYRVWILFLRNQGTRLFRVNDILAFDIEDTNKDRNGYVGDWGGVVRPWLDWETRHIEAESSEKSEVGSN